MKKENGMHREPYSPQKANTSPNKRKETITAPEYDGTGGVYISKKDGH